MTQFRPRRNDDDDDEERLLKRIAVALEDRKLVGFIHADIHGILDAVRDIGATLKEYQSPPGRPVLAGSINAIYGRKCDMPANVPVPKLLDTEKIELGVMPRKADGHIDAMASVSWTSSDESQVGTSEGTEAFDFEDVKIGEDGSTEEWREVVTCPGNFKCSALTPLASGTGTVTAAAAGYDSAVFGPINYEPGVARSLNPSVGSPVSDL